MKLIAEKYRSLKPTIEYLTDEVVMAQAWKKTHQYMRRHNWYADTLALDVSALGLESNVANWAEDIKIEDPSPYPLILIPAAKSDNWIVDTEKGWLPKAIFDGKTKDRKNKPPIRPLAHLRVRDQTRATAIMLCLADAVESAQGDCSEKDFLKAQRKKVYSYGNRLYCDWKDKKAWFRWGNSSIYRKFFTDYQNFLKRPVYIGRKVANHQHAVDHVFVVNLDLTKFYDHIDRTQLIERLKKHSEFYKQTDLCDEFWQKVEKIIDWQWDKGSVETASHLGLEIGEGLPQGLVASGFFANAYLVEFDKQVGSKIGMPLSNSSSVVLHDYCRYVDDLRLVISIEDETEIDRLAEIVNKWVIDKLSRFAGKDLTLNPNKTKVTLLSDLDNMGSLSGRVAQLQNDLSGPADRDLLESSLSVLEGLLINQPTGIPELVSATKDQPLIRLAKFDHDVRPDTLKRFAANRLETIMRHKRKVYVQDNDTNDINHEQSSLDNECELLAKKLIWAWMQDPALALVLRKAIEIYPSPVIAEPVFEAIFYRCSFIDITDNKKINTGDVITEATADFLLADLFRCCVDFQGYFQRIDCPESSDPDGLLALACRYAQKAVSNENLPKFIEWQALLLLAVMQKPVTFKNEDQSIQHTLHAILVGKPIALKRQNLALYEVAAQITGNADMVVALIFDQIENSDDDFIKKFLDEFAKRGGDFWLSIWKKLKKSKIKKSIIQEFQWAAPVSSTGLGPVQQRLSKLIVSEDNGFIHEAALIKLALALLKNVDDGIKPPLHVINIKQTQVSEKKVAWLEIWKPEVKIESSTSTKRNFSDPRFDPPSWLDDTNPDTETIYWLGIILRAVAVGNHDFTANRWKKSKITGYKGLRTNWFKRRMGMMHAPEALVSEYSTLSRWTAELLMTCLQWPGFEASYICDEDIKNIDGVEALKKALKNRLQLLDAIRCKASEMPAIITQVKRPEPAKKDRLFRLVTVQQLLPRTKAFIGDPTLDNPTTRARNRDHLSRICHLTYKTLTTKLKTEENKSNISADLIVFSEIAVHQDDQDLIKRLADKTKSIILAGLILKEYDGKLVNIARWFIPDYRETGRQWIIRDQGKKFPTRIEKELGVIGYRPCQHIIELHGMSEGPFKMSGAICYDATDLNLAADLKGKTDLFVVAAHNKDVRTFDTMASALHYHMYQHVVVVNKGEFGGSTIQAPYKENFDKLISHSHGVGQVSINVADLDLAAFRRPNSIQYKEIKTKPAGR